MTEEPQNEQRGYSASQVTGFTDHVPRLRNAGLAVAIDLSHLANQLSSKRARTFANEGIGRRLPLVERCVLNIYEMYPPDRQSFLSKDECNDIAIQLHAFAINLYALFDNIAWVCMLEGGGQLPPMKIGLFKQDCQEFIPQHFKDYLAQPTVGQWYRDHGKVYRDSTAHRIAPYLPSRAYTPEEAARWQELHSQAMTELLGVANEARDRISDRLDRHERLNEEKELMGSNSLLIGLSLTGEDAAPPVYMHPQLLCDWALAHELVREFTIGMRKTRGWTAPVIPPMEIA